MKNVSQALIACLLFGPLLISLNCYSAETADEAPPPKTLEPEIKAEESVPQKSSDESTDGLSGGEQRPLGKQGVLTDRVLLAVGARLDTAFSAGDPVQQGFRIPSMRLSVFGEVHPAIAYRLSVGQTREFASVLLPQLLPSEAYVQFKNADSFLPSNLNLKVGIFTPQLHPWWSTDLDTLPFADYFSSHRMLFLGRDIGAELAVRIVGNLGATLGIFNGAGIYGLNTNNSKAFTGSVRGSVDLGDAEVEAGWSGYRFSQSSAGSINYKSSWVSDFFLILNHSKSAFVLGGDLALGAFEDNMAQFAPTGLAVFLSVSLADWLRFLARGESVRNPPSGNGGTFAAYQLGPAFRVSSQVHLFCNFQYSNMEGAVVNATEIRLRLVI
ncbi:MAG: hypothetical protein HY537_18130 [Deltaproteobacteria bacterium]|nr:hypothetical protein [Deltaproteobacteria bacterium]